MYLLAAVVVIFLTSVWPDMTTDGFLVGMIIFITLCVANALDRIVEIQRIVR